MKLALLGSSGRMGREIERLALDDGHDVVARFDIDSNPGGDALREAVTPADVVVDFTQPDGVLGNIDAVTSAARPMVVGTTGWYDSLDAARTMVEERGTGLVWAANFSLGAQLLQRLAEQAAIFLDRFDEYDPYVVEHHHRGKRDAPSGTALRLAKGILAAVRRKKRLLTGPPEGLIPADSLQVTSVRAGHAFGHHRVGFDAAAETIEISHTARSRAGFARGALFAAEWIQRETGFYEFSELFEQVMDR